MKSLIVAICLLGSLLAMPSRAAEPLKALIIDGQNNHEMWPKTTFMMKRYLEDTGLFEVDIERTKFTWKGESQLPDYPLEGIETQVVGKPRTDPDFSPTFSDYDVVISNFGYNAAPWPEETKNNFEEYVRTGGGFVVVHAADNSFGDWTEFNQMIGLGGWGGRTEKTGPYVYYNDEDEIVRNTDPGKGGNHGPQHEFELVTRVEDHPITSGMPKRWLHTKDELYERLRGPAENMTILATAYAHPKKRGSGRHEPMLITIDYYKGRIFHTPLGHADYSMECVGFITSLQRGTEWAATGKVTQEIPEDFPNEEKSSGRKYEREAVSQ
ncbi:ThuA domain-containing protein [Adhaeretor mobilis]|uniref:Trehalose utilization n=1 Tax=Adhaeretor mobilis TaxID=1930276 RepID=A0A517MTY3_9BACT|nr:ThuA domain-containing protein [Adhaeretor mobilis]QDS98344.1 Trehalose utilization [Adhaeretor mobilis]